MLDIIIIITALIVLIIASIQDFKKREVMDWLNFSLIFFAVMLRLSYSLITSEFNYILTGIYGLIAAVIFSYIMFYTGQWGGGDAKLLMGLGALIGANLT
jgi:preflagellin peptidase FlaK